MTGDNASRTLTYTGTVNHTVYQNNLITIAKGKRNSWNFVWADAKVGSPAH